jgi:hypothetical protein
VDRQCQLLWEAIACVLAGIGNIRTATERGIRMSGLILGLQSADSAGGKPGALQCASGEPQDRLHRAASYFARAAAACNEWHPEYRIGVPTQPAPFRYNDILANDHIVSTVRTPGRFVPD